MKTADPPRPSRRGLAPLYAAGFTTAFGAHGIAAGLGAESGTIGLGLLTFGLLLALYDIAEIILKPVFGSLSDRIGTKPVIVGGLVAFALASLVGAVSTDPLMLGIARLGQGASAAAFSPASSAAVARMAGPNAAGSYFGKYGSWKALGYALGPLIGAALVGTTGFPGLFITLALIATTSATWVALAVPALPVLPRPRYTVIDLIRQTADRTFLLPTLALACATGALGVAVGFLPLLGSRMNLPLVASMATVTVLALASTISQPAIGRLRDEGRITARAGISLGLLLITLGISLLATVPAPAFLFLAALTLGLGIGITTPLGFAQLAITTPSERMGRTMGSAEMGREVGDAGGPLLVGGIASVATVTLGLGALGLLIAGSAALCAALIRPANDARHDANAGA
jgi:MFS family permease